MAISVAVPKDLSGIKTKVAMNLTKRQLICFGSAAAVGIPFYLVTKGVLGTQASAIIMVALMLPFFFWQCMKRRLPGREDFVLYGAAEAAHAGDTSL